MLLTHGARSVLRAATAATRVGRSVDPAMRLGARRPVDLRARQQARQDLLRVPSRQRALWRAAAPGKEDRAQRFPDRRTQTRRSPNSRARRLVPSWRGAKVFAMRRRRAVA